MRCSRRQMRKKMEKEKDTISMCIPFMSSTLFRSTPLDFSHPHFVMSSFRDCTKNNIRAAYFSSKHFFTGHIFWKTSINTLGHTLVAFLMCAIVTSVIPKSPNVIAFYVKSSVSNIPINPLFQVFNVEKIGKTRTMLDKYVRGIFISPFLSASFNIFMPRGQRDEEKRVTPSQSGDCSFYQCPKNNGCRFARRSARAHPWVSFVRRHSPELK